MYAAHQGCKPLKYHSFHFFFDFPPNIGEKEHAAATLTERSGMLFALVSNYDSPSG